MVGYVTELSLEAVMIIIRLHLQNLLDSNSGCHFARKHLFPPDVHYLAKFRGKFTTGESIIE